MQHIFLHDYRNLDRYIETAKICGELSRFCRLYLTGQQNPASPAAFFDNPLIRRALQQNMGSSAISPFEKRGRNINFLHPDFLGCLIYNNGST